MERQNHVDACKKRRRVLRKELMDYLDNVGDFILYGKVSNTDVTQKVLRTMNDMADVELLCVMSGEMILNLFTIGRLTMAIKKKKQTRD